MADPALILPPEALAQAGLLPSGATLLLLGGPDVGKTTWALQAVRALSAQGKTVAVLDCDLGQSEIGPPGTVGVALAQPQVQENLRTLRDLSPLALGFVGAASPARHSLEWCVAACQMARVAKKHRPDLLLVDTCGWVQGHGAVQAKRALADLLLPQAVFAFQRGSELDPLLRSFAHLAPPALSLITPAPEACRKTPAARATRRAARFVKALEDAQEVTVSWDQAAFRGTRLGLGAPVAHHLQQFISQSLRVPTLHAELSPGGGLLVVIHGERWDAQGLLGLESHFRTTKILVVPAQKWAGLYLGLVNAAGGLLGVGLLSRLDFSARTVTILTPCRRAAAIRQIWMGSLRLRPDGRERGETRPGEI